MPRPKRSPRTGPLSSKSSGWLAVSGSGLVSTGITAKDAEAAAKLARLKESTQVIYLPIHDAPPLALPGVFDRVRRALPDLSRVWLVGGSVRDALLNRGVGDLDFVVAGNAITLAKHVADYLNAPFFPLDPERGAGRIVLIENGERFYLDFAELRGDDITADLAARDFTVNAMAVSLAPPEQLVDPMGGQADLAAKCLRLCRPSALEDDPVRPLRAIRLAAQLDFLIERATREAARRAAPLLARVSAERVRDEFVRMLGGRKPAAALRASDSLGLLAQIVPEVIALKGVGQSPPHVFDVWGHTLAVIDKLDALLSVLGRVHDVDAASEFALGFAAARVGQYRNEISDHLERELSVGRSTRSLLFLAALLHDIAKPQTRSVESSTGRVRFFGHEDEGAKIAESRCAALRLSNEEIERITLVVAHHLRPMLLTESGVTRRAAYRFFKDTRDAGVDVCLLSLADMLGMRGAELAQAEWAARVNTAVGLLDAYFKQAELIVRPAPLIDGRDVIELLGVSQGPRVGAVIEAVREAQAAGEVGTREEAIRFAKSYLDDRRQTADD